jgi:predicted lipid-binding transport protein (Tim44 family)
VRFYRTASIVLRGGRACDDDAMRRIAPSALLAIALLALLAPDALAQAGGGSSGFSGGGGGGGGGGGYSGGGGSGGSGGGSPLLFFVFVALFGGFVLFGIVQARIVKRRRAHARAERDERVTTASAEAADDDPAFAADAVKTAAAALYGALQRAWSERDDAALKRMLGPDLLVEWRRRLADFKLKGWVNEVKILKGPDVRYAGLVNREGTGEDRVTVSIAATLHSVVRTVSGETFFRDEDEDRDGEIEVFEYWTLGRSGEGWRLLSIEQEGEGEHHLRAEIVTAPWSDARLADESLVELATADAPPQGTNVSELVSVEFDGTAREQALDLALADPRCAPDVLETAARRAAAAWAEAVDGADAALLEIATQDAARALLYAGADGTDAKARIVVRGPRLLRLAIAELETDTPAPRMVVEARLRGARYVEDRDTLAVLSGDREREIEFTERWTFALDGDAKLPWRLVDGGGSG